MNLNESKSIDRLHNILEDKLNKEEDVTSDSMSESLYSVNTNLDQCIEIVDMTERSIDFILHQSHCESNCQSQPSDESMSYS
jgi:hypothetical protein